MKVLVIHPIDSSTNFLSAYHTDFTVIRTELSDTLLKKLIRSHDVIVMMGHGTEDGLIGFNRLYINSEFVDELRKKICICIWCHASTFVQKYNLKTPFSTGMFISEREEAVIECVEGDLQDIIKSNSQFQDALGWAFYEMYKNGNPFLPNILYHYDENENNHPIKQFNINKFYSNIV